VAVTAVLAAGSANSTETPTPASTTTTVVGQPADPVVETPQGRQSHTGFEPGMGAASSRQPDTSSRGS
jgi:hypothetical protein